MDFHRLYRLDPDQTIAKNTIISRFTDPQDHQDVLLLPADTGYGKTRVAIHVAKEKYEKYGMHAAVLCPKTLIPMWKKSLTDAGVPIAFIFTFEKLAGKTRTGCNHPYLKRGSEPTGPYSAEKKWLDLVVNPGVFLICDECQALKNTTSARHWAFFELIRSALLVDGSKFRALHLSASPVDKNACFESLFRITGLILEKQLYHKQQGRSALSYEKYELGQLLRDASLLKPDVVKRMNVTHVTVASLPLILAQLWRDVYRERICIAVTDSVYTHPETGHIFERKRANLFVALDPVSVALAEEAMNILRKAHILRGNGEVNLDIAKRNFAIIQIALVKLCHAKLLATI